MGNNGQVVMVDSERDLVPIVEKASRVGHIGIDTEFVWERTFYPHLGLVQLGISKEECFLLDIPRINNLAPLASLLADPDVVKILHDAGQDLTILRQATGAYPKNIFDTRCAAGFAALSSTISLRNLVSEVAGVELEKSESRTDWLKRPLSKKQIDYALDDVRYLPYAREKLLERVRERGREDWLKEELTLYDDPSLYDERKPRTVFERVKGRKKLAPQGLARLRELAAWREEEARRVNRPRGHIVADEILVALARRQPNSLDELKKIKGISEREITRYGAVLLEQVAKGGEVKERDWPRTEDSPRDEGKLNARADFLLSVIKGESLKWEIDPALVASRAEVTSLLNSRGNPRPEDHRLLRGWRGNFVGEELLLLSRGEMSVRISSDGGLPLMERKSEGE